MYLLEIETSGKPRGIFTRSFWLLETDGKKRSLGRMFGPITKMQFGKPTCYMGVPGFKY